MADPAHHDGHAYEPPLETIFSFDDYYSEAGAQTSTLSTPLGGRPPSVTMGFEPLKVQEDPLSTPAIFSGSQAMPIDGGFGSVEGPPPLIETDREPPRLYHPPSTSNDPLNELQAVDDELEDVQLRLRRNELMTRRQEIVRRLPLHQREQVYGRPQSRGNQNPSGPVDHAASMFDHNSTPDVPIQDELVMAPTPSQADDRVTRQIFHEHSNHIYPDRLGMSTSDIDSHPAVAFTGPLGFESASPSNSTLSETSHPRVGRQLKMLGPIPVSVSDPMPMQSALTESPYGQHLNSIQPDLTSYSRSEDQPVQYQSRTPISQKRARSPQESHEQRLSNIRQQLSKRTGIPEISLDAFCYSQDPKPKRTRTKLQKQNKKEVENVGGACFLCTISRKKCSGQRPCDYCKRYWGKRVQDSTSFMWTCDVVSKLTDVILTSPGIAVANNMSYYEIFTMEHTRFSEHEAFMQKRDDLIKLMDSLEPQRLRGIIFQDIIRPGLGRHLGFPWLYLYIYSILRWKRALLYFTPEFRPVIAVFEAMYRDLSLRVFDWCDRAHKLNQRLGVILLMVLIIDEIKQSGGVQPLDPVVADHLKLALRSRLKILCARVFESDPSKKLTHDYGGVDLAMCIDYAEEASLCLPPHYWDCSKGRWALCQATLEPPLGLTLTRLDPGPCLLNRINRIHGCHNSLHADDCTCGWTFDCFLPGVLDLLGCSAQSFASHVHDKEAEAGIREERLARWARKVVNPIFRRPGVKEVSLLIRLNTFRSIVSITFRYAFMWISAYYNHMTSELSEMQHSIHTEDHHPYLLDSIMETALSIYHDFWEWEGENHICLDFRKSSGENQTNLDDVDKAILDFDKAILQIELLEQLRLWCEESPKHEDALVDLGMQIWDLEFRNSEPATGLSFDDWAEHITAFLPEAKPMFYRITHKNRLPIMQF